MALTGALGAWLRKQLDVCGRGNEVESRNAGNCNGPHDASRRRTTRPASGENIFLVDPAMELPSFFQTKLPRCRPRYWGAVYRRIILSCGILLFHTGGAPTQPLGVCVRKPRAPSSLSLHGVSHHIRTSISHEYRPSCYPHRRTRLTKDVCNIYNIRSLSPTQPPNKRWETRPRCRDGLSASSSARTCTPRRPMQFR